MPKIRQIPKFPTKRKRISSKLTGIAGHMPCDFDVVHKDRKNCRQNGGFVVKYRSTGS